MRTDRTVPTPDRPADDLDRLLRDFFRAQMPEPWPAVKLPGGAAPRPFRLAAGRWPWLTSRFALAATVAFCLVGSLALSLCFPGAAPPTRGADEPVIATPGERPEYRTTPSGRRVKVSESHQKNMQIIRVELDDSPIDD